MKSYLSLIPIYAKVHRKKSRMTRICIVLAVFLVSCIFGMADMEMRSQRGQIEKSDGAWHASFRDLTDEQVRLVEARPEIGAYSRYGVLNYNLSSEYTIDGIETAICGFDEGFLKIMPAAKLTDGTFPQADEAAITANTARRLGAAIGESIALKLPDGSTAELKVSALAEDTSLLAESDGMGIFLNMETFMGICASMGEPSYEGNLYVQFRYERGIQNKINNICTALSIPTESAHENIKLLGIIGQSGDSFMMQLYGAAAVLSVLVITAGTLMIGSSLNADVASRTEFYGMVRCLGASAKQVRRYVRLEALSWCTRAIPTGVGAAIIVTWILCFALRLLSPGYFAEMPIFGVSLPAAALGIVLGLATVLIAAESPAKRAAKVSPLEALRGGSEAETKIKKAANTSAMKVEYALGVRHAMANGRNFLLMTGSFALSIVLFLAFSTAIDFMHHAIRPLKPYSPDISIISADNSCSIPKATLDILKTDPSVKRAYGRMFAYNVPVETEKGEISVNLISYEQHQFKWAGSSLLEGSLEAAENGEGLLTVYDAENPLAQGDSITGDFGKGRTKLTVSGIISDSPFTRDAGIETLICSEELFTKLTGQSAYTILDMQLSGKATDEDVQEIRALMGDNMEFSDRRLSNQEARGAFYSMSIFMYGFLVIISLISSFNIINSMALSIAAGTKQYGTMRAIGMSDRQLYRMTLTEALSYAAFGVVFGCALGLPANRKLFSMLVTSHWGDSWSFPTVSTLIIVFVVLLSAFLSVQGPIRNMTKKTIVDTIHAE